MKTPLKWLLDDMLPTLLTADQMRQLNVAFVEYQREYGRSVRRQAKIDRLARLRENLKNPSSSQHIKALNREIAKLEQDLSNSDS